MAQQGGATSGAPDRPGSPPSPYFPITDDAAATTPVITDPLRYIATTLKEVERGFDELNQGLGYTAKDGGRRTVRERDEEVQLSLSKILVTQQAQIKRLDGQVTGLSTAGGGAAEEEGEEEEEEEWEGHPLLESLAIIEARLVEAQATNVEHAADIHRVADTFEKFGDLGDFVTWVGKWVRWVLAWTFYSVCSPLLLFFISGN
jgi:hypothetical protein